MADFLDEDGLDDSQYELMSADELDARIKAFRTLCMRKKINTKNAFDIDMIGYFHTWLEKKKTDSTDVSSFQDLADYLETSGTVYGYRVDNYGDTASLLLEEVRSIKLKKDMLTSDDKKDLDKKNVNIKKKNQKEVLDESNEEDEDEFFKPQTLPKRLKLMLTTDDKLKCKPMDSFESKRKVVFSFPELFKTSYPDKHMASLFYDHSVHKELIDSKNKEKQNKNNHECDLNNIVGDLFENELEATELCSDLFKFVAERDINSDTTNTPLKGIENYFDPEDNKFLSTTSDHIYDEGNNDDDVESINLKDSVEHNINSKNQPKIEGLLECIDEVNRDYSFFNPHLLANWVGPKSWKENAMVKALKSCKPSEQKEILMSLSLKDDKLEDDQPKDKNIGVQIKKKNAKPVEKNEKIKWLKMKKIKSMLDNDMLGKEQVLPHILAKWDVLENIMDPFNFDLVHRFTYLEYEEAQPSWLISRTKLNNKNADDKINVGDKDDVLENDDVNDNLSETSLNTHEVIDDFDIKDELQDVDNSDDAVIDGASEKFCDQNVTEDDEEMLTDLKSERMDIAILKKEILEIVNRECVEINPDSEWSKELPFSELLTQLKVAEREELSISIIFVGLLHLSNEYGLKIIEKPCPTEDTTQTCIVKPMNVIANKSCN